MSDRPQHRNRTGQPPGSDSPQADSGNPSPSPTQEIRESDTPIPPLSDEKTDSTASQQWRAWAEDAEPTQPQPLYGDSEPTQRFPPDLGQQEAPTQQWAPQPTPPQWVQPAHPPPHAQQQNWGQQDFPHQGYPQQNYQGPGYPQQWPQQQTNPHQGPGQQPYGQPPGQWQQPYPGYQQTVSQQPKRGKAWLYVIIAVLAVALIALLGWLFLGPEDDTSQPAATPSESREVEAEESETVETTPTDPATEEPETAPLPNPFQNPEDREFELPDFGSVPDMPENVGNYQALAGTFPTLTMYTSSSNNDVLVATYMSTKPLPENFLDDGLGPNTHGDWTCSSSSDSEDAACTAKAHDGFVILVAGLDEASLADLGDEFLNNWK